MDLLTKIVIAKILKDVLTLSFCRWKEWSTYSGTYGGQCGYSYTRNTCCHYSCT